ncbi:MAG: hypothetical protein EAZ53_10500, partial [Bacteroidetes bacterium]
MRIKATNIILKNLFIALSLLIYINKTIAQNCSVNANVDVTVCGNGALNLVGTKSASFASAWSQVSGPSVSITTPTTSSGSTHNSGVTGFTAPNVYVFKLTATCPDGISVSDFVTYTVLPITTANAGPDQTVCPGTYPLSANSPGVGETGVWSNAGGGLSFANTTNPSSNYTVNQNNAASRNITWTITNTNGCSSSDVVNITYYGGANLVSAGPNVTLSNCYSTTQSHTLAASFGGSGGGQGGTWSVVSGPNLPTFANINSNTSNVTNLIQGTYVLRWTVSGPCVNGTSTMTITVPTATQSVTNPTASNQDFCDGRSVAVLSGNFPSYSNESVLWVKTSGTGGTIVNPTSPNASVTGLTSTATGYTYSYIITNSVTGCSRTTSGIDLRWFIAPTINSLFSSSVLGCNVISASIPFTATGGNVRTYQIVSGPTVTGTSSLTASPLNIPGLTNGTYVVRLTNSQIGGAGACASAQKDVNLIISRTPTVSNPGTSQNLPCNIFSTVFAANTPSVGVGSWSQVSGPNLATINNPNLPTSSVTGMTNGNYTFRWSVSGGVGCSIQQNDVSYKVSSTVPSVAVGGTSQTICANSVLYLTGSPIASYETAQWSVTPSGAVFSNLTSINTIVTNLGINTVYKIEYRISNTCGANSDIITITTNSVAGANAANAGLDRCLPTTTSSVIMNGNAPIIGASGLWTKVTGPSCTIVNNTLPGTSITGMIAGTYVFEWSISKGGCSPTRDSVIITIGNPNSAATIVPVPSLCGSTTTLSGNTPVNGTGTWTQATGPGGATILGINNPVPTITGLVDGTYTFQWTISNGICPSSTAGVSFVVNAPSVIAVASAATFCGSSVASLIGNTPADGSGIWSQVSGPSSAFISTVTSAVTPVFSLVTGLYKFRWSVSTGPFCPASTADVDVPVSLNAAIFPSTLALCDQSSATVYGTAGSAGVWAVVSSTGTPIIVGTGSNSANIGNMSIGNHLFSYSVPGLFGCPNTSANIPVTVSGTGDNPNAGADQFLCNASVITLAGNNPVVGNGTWIKAAGPAGGLFVNSATGVTSFTGAVPGNDVNPYVFEWNIANGACGVFKDVVRIINYSSPSTATASNLSNVCSTSPVTLTGNNPTTGTGAWLQLSGPTVANLTSSITGNTLISNLTFGGYAFLWSISNGPVCAVSTVQMGLTVTGTTPTTATVVSPINICNQTEVELTGNIATVGTGTWTRISGPNTPAITALNNNITSLTGLNSGVYVYNWSIRNGSCTSTGVTTITNAALPSVPVVGGSQSLCPFDGLTLTGGAVASGTARWVATSGTSNPFIISPLATSTGVVGLTPGNYIFTRSVTSGVCTPTTAQVAITIATNCPPSAPNITISGFEDVLLSATITGWTDPDNTIPTITGVNNALTAQGGRITITGFNPTVPGSAIVRYLSPSNFSGIDTYIYQVCDDFAVCTTAQLVFTITSINDAPTVTPITVSGVAGTTNAGTITGFGDVDNPLSQLTVSGLNPISSGPNGTVNTITGGTVTISGTGAVTFQGTIPGVYTLNYQVCD